MKRNSFSRQSMQRDNLLFESIGNIFIRICSYPKLVLEVFLRKNFGRRYFTAISAATVATIMIFMPILHMMWSELGGGFMGTFEMFNWNRYISWYIFVALFIIFSAKRGREVYTQPNLLDINKYSLYSGDINPWFYELPFFLRKGRTPIL